jgi:ArsR family transcriptional regulator
MNSVATSLRLLGDETRLRALRVLRREELNSGELANVLGLAPSAVSRQMAQLRDAGLVLERRAGRFAYFRAAPDDGALDGLWSVLGPLVDAADDEHGDVARLEDVRRARRERELSGDGSGRRYVPGRSWAAWARAVSLLVPPGLRVVDLGCGEGALAREVGRFAARVVGVDRDADAIKRARAAARRDSHRRVTFRVADFESLPLDNATFDVAILSQTLHVTEDPGTALAEAVRVLVPGGRVVVLDLLTHDETWVRERLGHTRCGFSCDEMQALLESAGLRHVTVERMPARDGEPFRPLLASGVREPERRSRR